jgi:hypothetical protein
MDFKELGEFVIVKATDLAVAIDTGDEELAWLVWLPRSVVEGGEDMEEGGEYEISVKSWFAKKEGLV